jgi:aminoglycoside 2'-N-acetyltransferase I
MGERGTRQGHSAATRWQAGDNWASLRGGGRIGAMDREAAGPPLALARLSIVAPNALNNAQVSATRALLWSAFGDDPDEAMTEEDWQHAIDGTHFLLDLGGELVAYASVAERGLEVGGRPVQAGYVEAVATAVARQGQGLGSRLMTHVNAYIRERFELGALGTGRHHFYERLGWVTWQGPTLVRTPEGPLRTPDEDGYVLVLPTPTSPDLDLAATISCAPRLGDAW